jgi:hypothetical protein
MRWKNIILSIVVPFAIVSFYFFVIDIIFHGLGKIGVYTDWIFIVASPIVGFIFLYKPFKKYALLIGLFYIPAMITLMYYYSFIFVLGVLGIAI